MPPVHEVQTPNRRLDSWKEIAAFFDRDERTVKRWEKERSLPVHRLPGGSRARVFAFTDELSRWMHSPAVEAATSGAEPSTPNSVEPPMASAAPQAPASESSRKGWLMLAVIALLVLVSLLLLYRHQTVATSRQEPAGNVAAGKPATSDVAHPVDPAAQELYLKGRYHWDKRTPDDLNKAVDYFNQAIARDPNYAQAYVGLANCYNLLREFAAMPSSEAFPRALTAAQKAVQLDDSSAEAHNALAFVTFYWNWDAAAAEREFRRAIELDPNYVTAHHWYATFLLALRRYPEALREIERAQQLDPASNPILADKALILYNNGNQQEAIALLKQVEASQPDFFSTHRYLSYIYYDEGDYPAYLQEAQKSAALAHNAGELAIAQAAEKGYRAGGKQLMLQSTLQEQKRLFDAGKFPAFPVAATCSLLGAKEQTLHYLQISYQRHEPEFLDVFGYQPMEFLHNDPVFRKLIADAGLPPLPQ